MSKLNYFKTVDAAIPAIKGAIDAGETPHIVLGFRSPVVHCIRTVGNAVVCLMDWNHDGDFVPLRVEKTVGADEWFWCDAGAPNPRRCYSDKAHMYWNFEVPPVLRAAIDSLK